MSSSPTSVIPRPILDWLRGHTEDDLPTPRPTPAAALKWTIDEWSLQLELMSGRMRVPDGGFRRRLRSELSEAWELYQERGWLDDPLSYHRTPPPGLPNLESQRESALGLPFEHLRFTSEFEPWPNEPGRDRWEAYQPVKTGHAWMLRHAGAPRPWIVLVNGYRTGTPAIDLGSFRAGHLHTDLGLNVIGVVLPLHGPRAVGPTGSRVLHAGAMNTMFTLAQGAWDVRRVINYLRDEYEAPAVGLSGISLGGNMVSLVSSLQDDLACVIAGVPEADLVRGLRRQLDPQLPPFYEQWGLSWDPLEKVLGVASPMSLACKVPHNRRYIYGGLLDRWVRPGNVRDLWKHWDEPSILWYEGSHLSFPLEPSVRRYIDDALIESFDLKP
ncbi:MAG: alpha/beta hydrolase family protein [Acidimicrobiales bacterium]